VFDWEAFTVGTQHYLISAQHASPLLTESASSDVMSTGSAIYRWQGVEKFVIVHHIDSCPASDWETFTTHSGEVYLVCANQLAGVSQVFKVQLV